MLLFCALWGGYGVLKTGCADCVDGLEATFDVGAC